MRFPYFLVTLVSAWAISRWNVAVALHSPNGILIHWNNPSSHAKPVFSRSCFRSGICQNAEPKSNVVRNFASPSLYRLSSMREVILLRGHSSRPFPMRYRALFYLDLVFYKITATYVGLVFRKNVCVPT